MTKDFKVADSSTSSSGQYGISWVLGGIAVGLLAGAAVYATMNNGKLDLPSVIAPQPGSGQNPVATAPTQIPAAATAAAPNATLQDKPTTGDSRPGFSYHAVLPQLELDVPFSASVQEETADPDAVAAQKAAELKAQPQAQPTARAAPQAADQTAAAQPAAAQPAATQGRYLFQLGAYKTEAQASQMQAKAKRNGLNTRVESTNINGEVWYRVRLGPTADPAVVNKWKQMLSGMGISPMVIRL